MMVDFYWQDYKYFPYERVLAHRELAKLMGNPPVSRPDGFSVVVSNGWEKSAYRTTYFREAIAEDGSRLVPLQTLLETSANEDLMSRNYPINSYPPLSRQSTRYSAHGIHEYRGKFNPQIVRVVGNIVGLQFADWLLDPLCGCGTTLLEAAHIGWNAIGVDLNPLAIQISLAKIEAIRVDPNVLRAQTKMLNHWLRKRFQNQSFDQPFSQHEIRQIGAEDWRSRLPDLDYLRKWFRESVLVQLSVILDEIDRISSQEVQLIMRVLLSDILREVSLQDPSDLRVRRRKSAPKNAPAVPRFLDSVEKNIQTILKARKHLCNSETMQVAMLGDARFCATLVRSHPKITRDHQFDAAVTSPPYATALPYIDTQRLSLVLLGLINNNQILSTERELVGSREITKSERLEIEQAMETNAHDLPPECMSLCMKLKNLLDKRKDGFRRQNKPALVYRYLSSMALVFQQVHHLLKTGAPFALVVGRNKTRPSGTTVVIDTPRLLTLVAQRNGFTLQEIVELDTYQRYDIHRINSIQSESLIILRAI